MEAGGDERTRIVLQRKLPGRHCLHCSGEGHDHTICPRRPCYTCGAVGHLALSCPHRRRPCLGLRRDAGVHRNAHRALRQYLRDTELGIRELEKPPRLPSPQLGARVLSMFDHAHVRRVTALEWHPGGRIVVSGDKRGVIAVTDIGEYGFRDDMELSLASAKMHLANVSAFGFANGDVLWSGGMDGIVRRSNIEIAFGGSSAQPLNELDTVVELNPDGWTEGMTMARWRSITALAIDERNGFCGYGATCKGSVHVLDGRAGDCVGSYEKMHDNKIQWLDVNNCRAELLLSCGNDRMMSLWDVRKLGKGMEIGFYRHPKIVSGATFSPNYGSKIVTTCHDNRVRVWNDVNALVGNGNERCDAKPKEIVHSHNFNRYLSPFRAHWDPKDWTDDLFLVGRFLGDAYSMKIGGEMLEKILHPIDMFSARTGQILGSVIDMNVTTKCPMNKFSPKHDLIVSGTSLHLAFWGVKNKNGGKIVDDDDDGDDEFKIRKGRSRSDDTDDEDDDTRSSKKKRKTVTVRKKTNTTTVTHTRNTRSNSATR